jgi:hypothetical protein
MAKEMNMPTDAISALSQMDMMGDRTSAAMTGTHLLLAAEDLYNRLAEDRLQKNQFWQAMVNAPLSVPDLVFHGMCVENYHLLFRESYFDAPVLSFAGNTVARRLMNEFYREELGHDELLLKALNSVGLSREQLFRSVPLVGTMALCNGLSYWARYDPLFFFITLGPLEGRDVEIDSFVVACRARGLPAAFVDPIAAHANINKDGKHGLLTREIFAAIPAVASLVARRILRQVPLFVDIYDRFYTGIWHHYATPDAEHLRLLERV